MHNIENDYQGDHKRERTIVRVGNLSSREIFTVKDFMQPQNELHSIEICTCNIVPHIFVIYIFHLDGEVCYGPCLSHKKQQHRQSHTLSLSLSLFGADIPFESLRYHSKMIDRQIYYLFFFCFFFNVLLYFMFLLLE